MKFKFPFLLSLCTFCLQVLHNYQPQKFDYLFEAVKLSHATDPQFNIYSEHNQKELGECVVLIQVNNSNPQKDCFEDRNELESINRTNNINFFSKLELTSFNSYYCSIYAPYIEVRYVSNEVFERNDKKKIDLLCKKTGSCYEVIDERLSETVDKDFALIKPDDNLYYPFERALADVGVSYSDDDLCRNKGNGVKIGVLENKLPSSYQNFSGISYSTFGNDYDVHASQVASIAGGNYGIASEASFYFVSKESCISKFQGIDLMILNGVNVINHSGGFSPNPNAYNIYARYVDYIVKYTGCMFVNAAGNTTLADGDYFPNPSYGLNVISVGSSNRDLEPSVFNCKKIDSDGEYDSVIKKPNLFAPGDCLFGIRNICDGLNSNDCLSGTSFSAPIVTGIIALLMGEYPELKTNPAKLMSILTASCNKMADQENDFDNIHGFGIINYENARIAYQNSSSISSSNLSGNIFQGTISLLGGETFIICSESLYNASNITTGLTVIDSNSIQYIKPKINLYDQDNNIIGSSSQYGNIAYLEFKNNSNSLMSLHFEIHADNFANFIGIPQTIGYSLIMSKDIPNVTLSISNNYLDTSPTFNWSISSNKVISYVDMFITNFRGQDIFHTLYLNSQFSVTISPNDWGDVIDMRGREYYAFIRISFNDSTSVYSKVSFLLEPSRYRNHTQILPADYGFEEQYFFSEKTKNFSFDGVNISTRRLRCGYIQNQYIVLSPKRTGAGSAFFEMEFDVALYSVLIGLAWWSSNEGVDSNNGDSYLLEYKDSNNQWVEWLDLLNDVNITTNRDFVDRFVVSDSTGIKGIRLVCYCPSPTSDRNKGRICIDDIVLNQNYSFSFISQYYDPVF